VWIHQRSAGPRSVSSRLLRCAQLALRPSLRIAHCCRASRYQQALAQSRTVTSLGRGWSRASFRTRLASFWRSSASLAA